MKPVAMHANADAYTVFYLLLVLSAVGSIGWLIWKARRERSWLPLAAFGGALAIGCVLPPIYNVLTLVWFPSNIPAPFLTAFGMRDPTFDLLGYALFIGLGGYMVFDGLRRGQGARMLWIAFATWAVTDLALEIPFLQWDLYTYYGHQPLLIGGFPLHWVFMNGLVPVLTGVLMYGAVERWPVVDGRGQSPSVHLRIALCPAVAGGLLLVPIAPVATALNADCAQWVRVAAALLSIAISSSIMRFLTGLFATEPAPKRVEAVVA